MVRELTAVYWDRRFDAFDPELVAPFRLLQGYDTKEDFTQSRKGRPKEAKIVFLAPLRLPLRLCVKLFQTGCYNAPELITAQLSRARYRLHARPPEQLRHWRHQFTT